jgi:hypothetical protein
MRDIARIAALAAAVTMHRNESGDADAIRATANLMAAWLAGTTRLRITAGPVTEEDDTAPPSAPPQGGNVQLNTGQKVTFTVDTEDAAGYDTVETIEWTVDNADVVTLTVSEDTRTATCVSGAPGTATLTASIPTLSLSVSELIEVIPAGTATITLVAGDVEEENAEGPEEE